MSGAMLRRLSYTSKASLALRPARVHEACGQGLVHFALFQALRHTGPVVWVTHPDAVLPVDIPAALRRRCHFVQAASEDDLLWAAEEALRASPISLVIAQPDKPLSLTIGRRLQLAAEAGQTTGLLLISEGQGSNAAETRWICTPLASGLGSTLHHWDLIKNKMGTLQSWTVDWDGQTDTCHLVDEAAERPLAAPPSGGGPLCADRQDGEQ